MKRMKRINDEKLIKNSIVGLMDFLPNHSITFVDYKFYSRAHILLRLQQLNETYLYVIIDGLYL